MKKTFVNDEKIMEVVRTYPTPFHLYDEAGIRRTARDLLKAFSWNPGFKEYFAVKATPEPAILKILKEEGCGCDCASLTEMMLADRCGFSGSEIMFSSSDTPAEEYLYAYEHDAVINLDDISHIAFLKKILPAFPKKMSCRYNPGGVFTLGESGEGFQVMDTPEDSKFGMTRKQIFEAFRQLKALGVEDFGIHAFLASNTLSDEYYPALAKIIFQLAADLQKETGCHVTFVNLSGGVGIPYRPEDRKNDIFAIGEGVHRVYDEILTNTGMNDVAVYTELGRYMLGSNGCLVTKVLHLKHTYRDYAGVDANSAHLMRPAIYGAYHHITVVGKEHLPHDHVYDITGSLCENNDKLAVQRALPELEEGDLLVIHDTGAHGASMGFNYNGKLRGAGILLCSDGSTKLIRRAETPEDYFRTMIF
ncbi:MAG: diaminopimelate decarboxylase [Solobacterium sp.]|nr:diaminopimelate decarboxylase [Solobacterium sp.]